VLGSRLRAVSPEARSSARARSAHGSAPKRSNASSAARSCKRASETAQVLAEQQLDPGQVERSRVGRAKRLLELRARLLAFGEQLSARRKPSLCRLPVRIAGAGLEQR
jgi:hypothetical protein